MNDPAVLPVQIEILKIFSKSDDMKKIKDQEDQDDR